MGGGFASRGKGGEFRIQETGREKHLEKVSVLSLTLLGPDFNIYIYFIFILDEKQAEFQIQKMN